MLISWGTLNRIHSSEFWPIYFSKYTFQWAEIETILFKPLFNLFLSLFHWLPVTDVQHILIIKIIFAFTGSLQIYLFYLICKQLLNQTKQRTLLSLLLTLTLITEPYFLENYYRIRSDQLSTTVFLFILYLQLTSPLKATQNFILIILNCAIAIKSFFYSLLFSTLTFHKYHFTRKQKIYFSLGALAVFVWLMNIFWKAILYYLNTLESYSLNLIHFKNWLQSDFLIVLMIVLNVSFILAQRIKTHYRWVYFTVMMALIYTLISQKYSFFLASLLPLTYIAFAATFTAPIKVRWLWGVLLTTVTLHGYRLSQEFKFNSNFQQLKFIYLVEPFIKEKQYTYIDSVGLFPNQNNLNCFVSPDDHSSIEYCMDLITHQKVDIIIYTQRLMSIIQTNQILESGYKDVGFNVYVRSSLDFQPFQFENTYPALINFGFEM